MHLGAFSWVENVRPGTRQPTVRGSDASAVTRLDRARTRQRGNAVLQPVQQPHADNGGFIVAPSMTQAAAGAVLRSGYMTHRGTPDEAALMLDLSSDRVRHALWLLDGIRQGQTLAALTGYEFEQALHDGHLDVYIQAFRDRYPLIGDELTPRSPADITTPSLVVDGVKLRADAQAGKFVSGGDWGAGLPPPGSPAQDQVVALLAVLDDHLDALGDLSIAESVYQTIRGNFGRAGGLLDAVSRGDHPSRPDIVDTPRSGLDITHRLMLLIAGTPPVAPPWSGVSVRPRALAEPWLDAWVASRLPDPATVRCTVSAQVGGAMRSTLVSLRDLDIGPLDVLTLADAGAQPQRAELEQRILLHAALPANAQTVTISYAATGLPAGSITFPDLLIVARALRDLLNGARALVPQSFSLPEANASEAGGAIDLTELNARATSLVARLAADLTTLQTALTNVATAPQQVRDALLAASGYGVPGSIPLANQTTGDLTAQASALLTELQKRQTTALATPLPASDTDSVTAVVQTILGANALLLPRFTPPDVVNLQSAFAQASAMRAVDPAAPDRWLLQLSHVRGAAQRLDAACTLTTLLGAPAAAPLEIAQLPPTPSDRWLALPLDPAHPPAQGRVAIEALTTGAPATQTPYAGLLVDEWIERIPRTTESAGVSFHYEEPNARAPQVLLLAVCPDARNTWDFDLVRAILEETIELAKIRAVDLASIAEVGQILPGLYFPFNVDGATPSTRFLAVEAIHGIQN
jgi:hypothetical protein